MKLNLKFTATSTEKARDAFTNLRSTNLRQIGAILIKSFPGLIYTMEQYISLQNLEL